MIREEVLTLMTVFAVCLLFFNWPLVSIADNGFGAATYLFFFWAMAIASLWAVSSTMRQAHKKRGKEEERT